MTKFITLPEAMKQLDRIQEVFARERILRQPPRCPFGDIAFETLATPKAQTSSWAAHAMGFVWEDVKAWVQQSGDVLGLARKTNQELSPYSADWIADEMKRLIRQQLYFPTSFLRASASGVVDVFIQKRFAEWKNTRPHVYKTYLKNLQLSGKYWFRRSGEEQIWTGMHTALSAYFKMAETCAAIYLNTVTVQRSNTHLNLFSQASNFILFVATCHLEVLHGVEGYVWDHAGTEPGKGFICSEDGKELLVTDELLLRVEKNLLLLVEKGGTFESRVGCPAFVSMTGESSVMKEVQRWAEAILRRFYWPAVTATIRS